MKSFQLLFLALAITVPAVGQDSTTNAVGEANKPAEANAHAPGQTFLASEAVLTAPLVLTNDYFHLASDQSEVETGGKAVFNFTVTNAGNYEIEALVNAPDESTNSFFVNVDAQPTDPDMIWDIELTSGFEKRLVNWRGNGTDTSDDFDPKQFKLEPGAHTLILVGREPDVRLKSLTIFPISQAKPAAK